MSDWLEPLACMPIPKAIRQLRHLLEKNAERMAQSAHGATGHQISTSAALQTAVNVLEAMVEYAALKAADGGEPGCTLRHQHGYCRDFADKLTPKQIMEMMGE